MVSVWVSPMGQISSMERLAIASSHVNTGQIPPEAIISWDVQQKSQGESSQRSGELVRHTVAVHSAFSEHVNSFTTVA
eukprot:Skav212984  [mRNA]  locus=scaffold423:134622:135145:+ [translate_table: standard]